VARSGLYRLVKILPKKMRRKMKKEKGGVGEVACMKIFLYLLVNELEIV
jgi:hypothetical protein